MSGCAALTPEVQIAKLKGATFSEFIGKRFPIRSNTDGRTLKDGEFLAYFNEVNSYELYRPKREFDIFCNLNEGNLQLLSKSTADPISNAPLPAATSMVSWDERKAEREKLLAAYNAAINSGAIGTFRCINNSTKLVEWTVSLQPRQFYRESSSNLLSTNKLMLDINVLTP